MINSISARDSLPERWRVVGDGTSRCASQSAHSADPDQPFRPIVITDSGDPDHAVHYA
jgi:hypothetical protein